MSGSITPSDTFVAKTFTEGSECTIHFSGAINENADFNVIKIAKVKVLRLELKGVTSLNSMGLRKWVIWVKSLPPGCQIFVRECPRAVVDQMNILYGFLPMGAIVESFFLPYACNSCSHEENVLAVRGRDFMEGTVDAKEGVNLPPTRVCPLCQGEMEMDIIPAKYLSFLKYRR